MESLTKGELVKHAEKGARGCPGKDRSRKSEEKAELCSGGGGKEHLSERRSRASNR